MKKVLCLMICFSCGITKAESFSQLMKKLFDKTMQHSDSAGKKLAELLEAGAKKVSVAGHSLHNFPLISGLVFCLRDWPKLTLATITGLIMYVLYKKREKVERAMKKIERTAHTAFGLDSVDEEVTPEEKVAFSRLRPMM